MDTAGLLLIDLQEDFLGHPDLAPGRLRLLYSVTQLLSWARSHSLPVLHVQTRVRPDGVDAMPHWQRHGAIKCVTGSAGAEAPPELKPLAGEPVFYKQFFDPFEDPELSLFITQQGITRLIVAGVHTHACVRQAVVSAYARRMEVFLVMDAVASYDPGHAGKTLAWLSGRAATLVSVKSLCSALPNSDISTPIGISAANAFQQGTIVYSPCDTRQQLFTVDYMSPCMVTESLTAQLSVQPELSCLLPADRSNLLRQWRTLLLQKQTQWVRLLASDIGKPVRDAQAEFDYGISLLDSAVIDCLGISDAGAPTVNYKPMGMIGVITPWNNPFALAIGKLAPALGFGNVVAWKPAPNAWRISTELRDSLEAAGLGRYLTLLSGDVDVGERLVQHPSIGAVTFTGSAAVGKRIAQHCARLGKRFQGEMGASNAAVVLADADLEEAAQDLATAIFSFAGQRCTAIRRIIVDEKVIDPFRQLLVTAVANLRVGDPMSPETDIGPVISDAVRNSLHYKIEHEASRGAMVVAKAILPDDIDEHGAWLAPTVLEGVHLNSPMWNEEQFGPVAVMQRCKGLEEAITLHNHVRYGLLGVVYTASKDQAQLFIRKAQVGICSVNLARPAFKATGPFTGWKESASGIAEHGRWNRDFYTYVQAVYEKA